MSIFSPEPDLSAQALAELDRKIVLATQAGLPVAQRPYDLVAEQVGENAGLVKQRLQVMLDEGRIRRIGLVPNHYRLGYIANGMSVWDIKDSEVIQAGELVGSLEMVSHCYQRPRALPDWPYNLFAMVHGHQREEVEGKVAEIAQLLGKCVRSYDILFSTRILKKTGLRISRS